MDMKKSVNKVPVGASTTNWGASVGGSKPTYTSKYGEGLGVASNGKIHAGSK